MEKEFYGAQRKRVYNLLSEPNPNGLTRLQVAKILGIERASVCRRVAELMERNQCWVVKKGLCPITGERAEFLTSNVGVAINVPVKEQKQTGELF